MTFFFLLKLDELDILFNAADLLSELAYHICSNLWSTISNVSVQIMERELETFMLQPSYGNSTNCLLKDKRGPNIPQCYTIWL